MLKIALLGFYSAISFVPQKENCMKLIYLLGVCALTLSIASCSETPKEEAKTIIITEKVVEQPTPVVIEVEKDKKETSIKIGPDGGSLETKKVDIEINK